MRFAKFNQALRKIWAPFLRELGYEGKPGKMSRELPDFIVTVELLRDRDPGLVVMDVATEALCLRGASGLPHITNNWQVRPEGWKHEFYKAGGWLKAGGEETVEGMVEAFKADVMPKIAGYEQPGLVESLASSGSTW